MDKITYDIDDNEMSDSSLASSLVGLNSPVSAFSPAMLATTATSASSIPYASSANEMSAIDELMANADPASAEEAETETDNALVEKQQQHLSLPAMNCIPNKVSNPSNKVIEILSSSCSKNETENANQNSTMAATAMASESGDSIQFTHRHGSGNARILSSSSLPAPEPTMGNHKITNKPNLRPISGLSLFRTLVESDFESADNQQDQEHTQHNPQPYNNDAYQSQSLRTAVRASDESSTKCAKAASKYTQEEWKICYDCPIRSQH
ncbi:hypothetical protein ACLKA6_010455 [Drosophila palustris]